MAPDLPHPYIKIFISATQEPRDRYLSILETIQHKSAEAGFQESVVERNPQGVPYLKLVAKNVSQYEDFFRQDFFILDKLMEFTTKNDIDLRHFFSESEGEGSVSDWDEESDGPGERGDNEANYLVLKYETNLKGPLRDNLKYFQWFSDQVNEFIHFEETEDGFLRFYRRRLDFLSNNMNRNTLEGINKWFQLKKAQLPQKVLDFVYKILG